MKEANVSLVAFYGDKPIELVNLITRLQTHLANHSLLGKKFTPYQIEQVHGTIIGCEGYKTDLGIITRWFKERRQITKYINISGFTRPSSTDRFTFNYSLWWIQQPDRL